MTSHFQIRDPIHGVIFISLQERAVMDSLAFQRLRYIKQLGFADFAFPSATHSRYSHSLGAMAMASKIFDRVITQDVLNNPVEQKRFKQCVRLAALLHDVGHAPFSHSTEMVMPMATSLDKTAQEGRRATHEDYTRKIIMESSLTAIIEDCFSHQGITPAMIAYLIHNTHECKDFIVLGTDFGPVLRQIISSEIDCDRMDYLLRDSFFCGVNYGKFDADWLIENLLAIEKEGQWFLGLKHRALFAFEDFLLSRYHMFLSVYLHHTPIIMEKMLLRFFMSNDDFSLPTDIEAYLNIHDFDLWQLLRKSNNPWAQRIVNRNPYVMIEEQLIVKKFDAHQKILKDSLFALENAKIDSIMSRSKGVLSKYFGNEPSRLFVEMAHKKVVNLEECSPLFARYQTPTEVFRLYVDKEQSEQACAILSELPCH